MGQASDAAVSLTALATAARGRGLLASMQADPDAAMAALDRAPSTIARAVRSNAAAPGAQIGTAAHAT